MGRRKPFSGKAKKAQLKAKRAKAAKQHDRQQPPENEIVVKRDENEAKKEPKNASDPHNPPDQTKPKQKPRTGPRGQKLYYDPNKLKTVFVPPPKFVIEARKRDAQRPFQRLESHESDDKFCSEVVDIPIRPDWSHQWTGEQLHENEERYFENYLYEIYDKYGLKRLNRFEHNLAVWRQLWRVCEISDLLLVLADARYPLFHFSPSLYRYVVQELQKPMVLVLTKIDLVSREHLESWKLYLSKRFPKVVITEVTPFPNFDAPTSEHIDITSKMPRRKRKCTDPFGLPELLEKCRVTLKRDDMDSSLKDLALDYAANSLSQEKQTTDAHHDDQELLQSDEEVHGSDGGEYHQQSLPEHEQDVIDKRVGDGDGGDGGDGEDGGGKAKAGIPGKKSKQDYVAIGLIGHPNVGKSSLINALMGKHRVAVSSTPGRTKHLQTLFVRPDIQLVDCPGLIFPAVDMPLGLQVLSGVCPISQTSEPYSSVQYLAERVPIEKIYKLRPPQYSRMTSSKKHNKREKRLQDSSSNVGSDYAWSAWDICDAYAELKQYRTRKGRPDSYRAANEMLRDCFSGRVVLTISPPKNVYETGDQK